MYANQNENKTRQIKSVFGHGHHTHWLHTYAKYVT